LTASAALHPADVEATLETRRLGRPLVILPSCISTNDEVADRAASGAAEGLLITAEEQKLGRGRRGRAWHSPASENLYFSLLLRPAETADRMAPLSLLAGVALADSLVGLGFSPKLKWPNDVLLETSGGWRKVAGILAEMASEGGRVRHVVLGIGVNVNTRSFPAEIEHRATSLLLARGAPVDRGGVLAAFLNAFEPMYDEFVARGPAVGIARWRRLAWLGQPCFVERGAHRLEGIAVSVDETGALLIETLNGNVVSVHAGEVNWPSAM
jgi:BirA family transcriptional regulator, biotin operon repressor / biotin---[acetyl-CoA-carboxylase] ligase